MRRPPKRARLTPSTLKALSEREEGGEDAVLALKRRARALEVERSRSTIAVAAADTADERIVNGRRRGALNIKRMWAKPEQQLREKGPFLRRVLASARERGEVTDFSYALLLEVLSEVMGTAPNSPSTVATSTDSPSIDADPLDLDLVDESEIALPTHHNRDHQQQLLPDQSELMYQSEAAARQSSYKRGHLDQVHAVGVGVGLVCHSPFDAAYVVSEEPPHSSGPSRRELRPLRLSRDLIDPSSGVQKGMAIRDLNMPGFVRAFITSLSSGFQGEADAGLQRMALEALARCHTRLLAAREHHQQPPPLTVAPSATATPSAADTPFSVEDRQLLNIVNACWDLGACETTKARRKESSDLYKRLARALDQRAAPADRLFQTSNKSSRPRTYRGGEPALYMRGSLSKHMYGDGTNIFRGPRYHTSLAAYDPYT